MEMCMKANGLEIKPMDMVNIFILMEQNILENGKMINKMDMVFRNG
jgi:hypothetical protein